ncbi:MAG: VOC family protein [Candidatus Manganitrophaceae bacterium]
MGNPFCHVELQTQDIAKAKKFYKELFDWKLKEDAETNYTMIEVGEGVGGGMMKNPVPGAPSQWMAYVLVEDVQASMKKAASLGAKVLKEVTEIPGYGSFCVIADPTDAVLALWQTKGKM